MYSNESERANQDIYDDLKLKKNTLVFMIYTQIFHRFKGQVYPDGILRRMSVGMRVGQSNVREAGKTST